MKKKQVLYHWLPFLLVFTIICNIPIVSILIGVTLSTEYMNSPVDQFTSGQGGFGTSGAYLAGGAPQQQYADLLNKFEAYKKSNPTDSILYRHFNRNPLRFWEWYRYWLNRDSPFYNLPYKKYEVK